MDSDADTVGLFFGVFMSCVLCIAHLPSASPILYLDVVWTFLELSHLLRCLYELEHILSAHEYLSAVGSGTQYRFL